MKTGRVSNRDYSKTTLKSTFLVALVLVSTPLLSVLGAQCVCIPVLLLMVLLIASVYLAAGFADRIPTRLYPAIVFAVSLALLFHMSLISKYLMGYDIQIESYVFRVTQANNYWDPGVFAAESSQVAMIGSVLSVTILPTVYANLLGLEQEAIFKIIYPLLYSFIPLTLYQLYQHRARKSDALLSVFFFVSSPIGFYGVEPVSLARQMIAEVFFLLCLYLILNRTIPLAPKRLLLVIFGAAMVLAHYSISYIYLFFVLAIFIYSKIKDDTSTGIGPRYILFFTIILFSWYTYVSPSPTLSLVQRITLIANSFFKDLFNPLARTRLSPESPTSSIVYLINWLLLILVNSLITFGILKHLILKSNDVDVRGGYGVLLTSSIVIILLCIAIPRFAPTINITRFYHIALMFLSPFFVAGGKAVTTWTRRGRSLGDSREAKLLLTSIVLTSYFISQVGFINHVSGDAPYSFSIDFERRKTSSDLGRKLDFYAAYIPDQEALSASWLSMNARYPLVYSDYVSTRQVLKSYGLMSDNSLRLLTNTSLVLPETSYVYLRRVNVVEGVILSYTFGYVSFNISDIRHTIERNDKVFSNLDSEIYFACTRVNP